MRKLKINLLAIIGLMVAVTTVAFTAPKNNSIATESWYFTGDDLNDAKDADMYISTPSQSCSGFEEVPCEIQFETEEHLLPVTNTPLENYLNSHPDEQSVKDDAVSRRSS